MLFNAAKATTVQEFKKHMRALEELDKKVADWLKTHDPKCWSRHAFSTRAKSDMLLNNIAEPFNSFILEARDKPILTMLEMIRRMLMKRFTAKKEGMIKYPGPICPWIQVKLDKAKQTSNQCFPYMVGDGGLKLNRLTLVGGLWT